MGSVLGLDAGGTYTDSVVMDADTKQVLFTAKTPTTPSDITECLGAAFAGLPADLLGGISMVCLSTTLATNAVVEGRGARTAAIVIGGKPRGALPTTRQVLVQGRYDLKGRQVENLDPGQVRAAAESLRGTVDAVAVSGYASVRNPEHERYVKAVVEDVLDVPVVCAHELTTELGFHERTVTAVLNARLIPMVLDLTDAVRQVMRRFGIDAPLMMVRGDGTLMPDGVARTRPIETILSGPAASTLGAVHLSGRQDCLVADIGGTTTDVAHVREGRLVTRHDGAHVGGWRTQVRAAEVLTVGLGGDSRVVVDGAGRLRIGPHRSMSYSLAALEHPHLEDELAAIVSSSAHQGFLRPDHEAYALAGRGVLPDAAGDERTVLDALHDGAHTVWQLQRMLDLPALEGLLSSLARDGVLQRISLTPTDLWHVTGQYRAGSVKAAELGLLITAGMLGLDRPEFIGHLQRSLREQLDLSVVRAAMHADQQDPGVDDGGPADYFLRRLTAEGGSPMLRASYELLLPVVAIGGPAATLLSDAGERRTFAHEVPEHAEVANAVGAAVAHAVESVDVLIRKDMLTGQYLVFSSQGKATSPTLERATELAVASGAAFLRRVLGQADVLVEARHRDVHLRSVGWDGDPFVERVVTVEAHPQARAATR